MRTIALVSIALGLAACGGDPDCFDYEELGVPPCAGERLAIPCSGEEECDTEGGAVICLDSGTPVRGYQCDCGGDTCVLVVEMSACGWYC